MQFIDEVKIFLESGSGGNGSSSFRREKFIPNGGPDGGDGGRGGSIIFECVKNLNTLIDFRFKQHFKAKSGENGRGKNQHGSAAEDLILQVPIGTEIISQQGDEVLSDMTEVGQRVVVVKGGKGGLGNSNFKSSTNRAPTYATKGEEAQKICVYLKLKLLSDAGLLGLPNAGKSTFLAATTRAKPKIADYPFTTLKPQLGVVYVDDHEFVLADIPGIIEGASDGKGLGDRFLKHIERCRVLLHLIDISDDNMNQNYQTIRQELSNYNPELAKKPEIIAVNKIDILNQDEITKKIKSLKSLIKKQYKTTPKIFPISAATNKGLKQVLRELYKEIKPLT